MGEQDIGLFCQSCFPVQQLLLPALHKLRDCVLGGPPRPFTGCPRLCVVHFFLILRAAFHSFGFFLPIKQPNLLSDGLIKKQNSHRLFQRFVPSSFAAQKVQGELVKAVSPAVWPLFLKTQNIRRVVNKQVAVSSVVGGAVSSVIEGVNSEIITVPQESSSVMLHFFSFCQDVCICN